MGRSICWLFLATVLVVIGWAAPSASASFDNLPGETLGDAPYRSAAEFDATTAEFDSSNFTEQPAEIADPGAYMACGGRGAKTAWVRFATAVAGNLKVNVVKQTPGDLFYIVYTAPTVSPSFGDLSFLDCQDGADGPEESYSLGDEIPANSVVFVQTLVQCRPIEPACDEGEREAAPGGPTTVRLRFTPNNLDGDSLPDSIDGCPTVAGAVRGCPDADGDGVGDADDACPREFGKAANGCRLADQDGDGYAASGGDCNDNNPAIHPSARDIPHNGVDEDCSGDDSSYPRLHNEVAAVAGWSPRLKRTVDFLAPFKVEGPLVKGMTVRLRCQGRGCPISRQTAPIRARTSSLTIGKRLVKQVLAPGASVTVTITRPEYVGEAMRYTIRRHGKVRIEALCVPPGEMDPQKQCG